MTTQLTLYNGALRELGERKLASLSENREPRRLLDDVWTGAIKACLEEADWKFAQRTAKLIFEPSFEPTFGYRFQFTHPDDWVRWSKVCQDERQDVPLLQYHAEAGSLFADLENLYVSYVSNDTAYGNDMSLWPESFIQVVEFYLATRIVKRLEQSTTEQDRILKLYKRALLEAKSKDAMMSPTKMLPTGSWVNSRGYQTNHDRGNRGRLIG